MGTDSKLYTNLFFVNDQNTHSFHPLGFWGPGYLLKNEAEKESLTPFAKKVSMFSFLSVFLTFAGVYFFGKNLCDCLEGLNRMILIWPIATILWFGIKIWTDQKLKNCTKYSYWEGVTVALKYISQNKSKTKMNKLRFFISLFIILLIPIMPILGGIPENSNLFYALIVSPVLLQSLLSSFAVILYQTRSKTEV